MIKDYYVPIPPHLFDILKELAEETTGIVSDDFDVVIENGTPALFNFSYPISGRDKADFETYFANRFLLRRIGSGNFKKWKQMLRGKLLEIMPYYKQLLDSEHITFDPLINNDITTTDDATGTLDTTRDKRTDNDYAYTKSGETHNEHDNSGTHSNEYEKDGTTTTDISKSGTGTKDVETSGTHSNQYSKSGTESGNTKELNRYLDTPQGDSSRVWETDAQGNVVLSDYYITDVRGITTNANRSWSESGSDSGSTTGTSDEDTTFFETTDDDGTYHEEGSDSGSTTDTGESDGTYSETGSDQRDIVEHEVIDTDTTNTNENYKLGVSGISKSKLLSEYRETFLRIYNDIVAELEPLFYNLVEVDDLLDFV